MDDNKEITVLNKEDNSDYDFDLLEQELEENLKFNLDDLELLEKEKAKISNPEYLGNAIMSAIWDQFVMQIGSVAGEDFIKENQGLTLDLSKDAHIQTTENFAKGKIATHNKAVDYQERYDTWQGDFQHNTNGKIVMRKDNITGKDKAVLTKEARRDFDKDRPKGSKTVNIDHTVSAAEITRDPKAGAHLSKKEKVVFANSDKNLNPIDAAANQSKSDHKMDDWLNHERDGKKPGERFNIDEKQLKKKDKEAREEYKKRKDEGEKRSIETGKASRKQEAFKIGGKAFRSAMMIALADLIRNIISKLIDWLKQKEKNLQTLIDKILEAIKNFISNLKKTIMNMSEAVASTFLSALGNPIVNVIQRIWMIIKQGGRSITEAVEYLRNPDNKDKPFSIMILELGEIIVAGLTAVGALFISEAIEKALSSIPGFAIEIPLLGSTAGLIGMFMGAVISGVAGALVLNMLDSIIAKQSREAITQKQIESGNTVVNTQAQLIALNDEKITRKQMIISESIAARHKKAAEIIGEVFDEINDDSSKEQLNEISNIITDS